MDIEKTKFTVSHLGKEFTTINIDPTISDEVCERIRTDFYVKPELAVVNRQLYNLYKGGKVHNHVIDYFIKQVLIKAKLKGAKWSIYEFMQSNGLIRFALTKVRNFPKVFPPNAGDVKNINAVFRLSPSGTAAKVSNFPYKTMVDILKKYNLNGNYYDYSCGWGIRMLASLNKNVNYFGSEPNSELVVQLNKLYEYRKSNVPTSSTVQIFEQGSEVHINELENRIGLAFSSPPYFDLEEYGGEGQSISNRNYTAWLNEYWFETVKNINTYLIDDGYFLINIKNIKGFNLSDDMCDLIVQNGFKYIESFELKNINRIVLKQHGKNSDERIYVFRKL